jgi:transporter family-2 protein
VGKLLIVIITALGGMGLSIQAAINARLRVDLGHPLWAGVTNFTVGLLALLAVTALLRVPVPDMGAVRSAPGWVWIGGLIGASFVVISAFFVREIGVAGFLGIAIAGQLLGSLILDHLGLFGLTVQPISMLRVVGAVGLVVSAYLVKVS